MRLPLSLIAAGLLGAISVVASAKDTRHPKASVAQDAPVSLRHLAGKIVDPKGQTIAYAAVDLLDAQGHVIVTTFADAKGSFFFADRKPGEALAIRVSLKGFSTVQYAVVFHRLGRAALKVVLPLAR